MNTESFDDIEKEIENKNWERAFKLIQSRLSGDNSPLELHIYRLSVLPYVSVEERFNYARESAEALKESHLEESAYSEPLQALRKHISKKVVEILQEIKADSTTANGAYLYRIASAGKHFPESLLLHGFANLIRNYTPNFFGDTNSSGGFGSIFSRNNNSPAPAYREHLERYLELGEQNSELYAIGQVCMAEAEAIIGNLRSAMQYYDKATQIAAPMANLWQGFSWVWKRALNQILLQLYHRIAHIAEEKKPDAVFLQLLEVVPNSVQIVPLMKEIMSLSENHPDVAVQHYSDFMKTTSEMNDILLQQGTFLKPLSHVCSHLEAYRLSDKPFKTTHQELIDKAEIVHLSALKCLVSWDNIIKEVDELAHREPPFSQLTLLWAMKAEAIREKQRAVYQQSVETANTAYQNQQWEHAEQHYQVAFSTEFATSLDRVHALITAYQLGVDRQRLLFLLNQIPVEAMQSLGQQDSAYLLELFIASGMWAESPPYLEALSLSPQALEHYQQARIADIEAHVQQGNDALSSREEKRALEIAKTLEKIEADTPSALIYRARVLAVQNKWNQVRHVLMPLGDRIQTLPDAITLLIHADIEQGYFEMALGRLNLIHEVAHREQLEKTIYARADQTPYFHVIQHSHTVIPDTLRRVESETWNCYFAVELKITSISRLNLNTLRTMFSRDSANFLTALHNNPGNTVSVHYSWRYVAQKGKLSIVLMCCVEATYNAQQALADAQDVWDSIRRMLPLQSDNIYQYEPIYQLERLLHLLEPFVATSASQIIRKEVDTSSGGLHIQSLQASESSMNTLLKSLLEHPDDVMLEVYFEPTQIMAWEKKQSFFNAHVPPATQNDPPATGDLGDMQVLEQFLKSMNSNTLGQYFGNYPYVVQIRVLSAGKIGLGLRSQIRVEMFGQSPVDFISATTSDELETAKRNMRQLRCEKWGYELPIMSSMRWRYLYSPSETLVATRLPLPKPEGLIGVQTTLVRQASLPTHLSESGVCIGELLMPVNGRPKQVNLSIDDRLRHVYAVGRTGTGKSSLLQRMILQDIEQGRGVIVIDPHGDLVEGVLERCPEYRESDVMLFDPSDIEYPIGFNLLDVEGDFPRNTVIADFIGLLYAIFDPSRTGIIGPRFENAVRQSMLVAMELQDGTFLEMVRMMADSDFRNKAVEFVEDPIVQIYWKEIAKNFASLGDGNMMDYVTSKFARFQVAPLKNIIGQGRTVLDFERIMREKKILLVNLSKGKIGPETSQFLGLVLIPQIFIAILKRANLSPQERHPVCLYVDEFHNLTTSSFALMLAEARKYGLAITVANQFISQLTDSVREAIFGNVGTLLSFRVGVKDAGFLSEEYHPAYDSEDLINLPNYHLLMKTLTDGEALQRFPLRTLPDTYALDPDRAVRIRNQSRTRYGRDKRIVEHEIAQRLRQTPQKKRR